MTMDGRDALDDLADLSRQRARCDLPLLAETQLLAPEPRDQHGLRYDDEPRDRAQRKALGNDEGQRGQGLPTEEYRRDESIADEAAHGLDFVVDNARHFRRL